MCVCLCVHIYIIISIKQYPFIISQFLWLRVQAQFNCIFCSGFHNSVVRVLVRAMFLFSFSFIFCLFSFIYLFSLQYCIGFAIHWHESTMGVHVFPILNLPPHPILLVHPRAPAPSTLSYALKTNLFHYAVFRNLFLRYFYGGKKTMSTEFQDIIPSGLQFLFHIMRLLGHDICGNMSNL